MKAIILAAGIGSRLYPITKSKPKCLVELFGKSIIEHQIDIFRKCGINEIIIVRGYLSEMINFDGIKYYDNPNYETTNMVETLFCAQDELNDSVIVSYGDIIFEKKILESLISSNFDLSVIIDKNWKQLWEQRFKNPLDDAESLILDPNGLILELGQKVSSYEKICGQYIGLMKFQGNDLEFIRSFYQNAKEISKNGKNPLNPEISFEKSYMTDFLNSLIKNGKKIHSVEVHGGWLELDSISDLELYKQLDKTKTLSNFFNL